VLADARAQLASRAGAIQDPWYRRKFLQDVPKRRSERAVYGRRATLVPVVSGSA
jgi:hypothetical protein